MIATQPRPALHYKQCRPGPAAVSPPIPTIQRRCLSCDKSFPARGPFNRICPYCAANNIPVGCTGRTARPGNHKSLSR